MIKYLRKSDNCSEHDIFLSTILSECKRSITPEVSVRQLRRWWNIYQEWGELPADVKKRVSKLNKVQSIFRETALTKTELRVLKEIVDENPHLYLDEIVLEFGYETGKFMSRPHISRVLRNSFGYSLKVMSEVAKQRKKEEEERFLFAMALVSDRCPERIVLIDESHKDRNAARRRRGWDIRNAPIINREFFRNSIRYTLMAAADINGFIPSACHCVHRDHISEEGAAGTVDRNYFLYWVKQYLCPKLGNFLLGEPRSIVFMDNASTHMTAEVVHAIESTGATVVFGAPYSPHLNPIEKYFSVYKAYLIRNHQRMLVDWETVHLEALNQVNRDQGINFFRHCKVPGSSEMFTTEEWNKKVLESYM